MKVYGKKVLTKPYPCRFPDIQAERKEGGFQIEIVVPKADIKERVRKHSFKFNG